MLCDPNAYDVESHSARIEGTWRYFDSPSLLGSRRIDVVTASPTRVQVPFSASYYRGRLLLNLEIHTKPLRNKRMKINKRREIKHSEVNEDVPLPAPLRHSWAEAISAHP